MSKFEIHNAFTTLGEWFLPHKPEARIPGTFSWEKGARIELHGSFEPLRSGPIFGDGHYYDAVFGETSKSELVTLLSPRSSAVSINFGKGGLRTPQQLRTSIVLVGTHALPSKTYRKLRARIPGLELWLDQPGISSDFEGESYRFEVPRNPGISLRVDPIFAEVKFATIFSLGKLSRTSLNSTGQGYITLEPSDPQTINWHLENLGRITDLLSLISGQSLTPDFIELATEEPDFDVAVLVRLNNDLICSLTNDHGFFLTQRMLGADLKTVLNNCFSRSDILGKAYHLACNVLLSKDLWLHVEFLTLMHAIEGFHRAVHQSGKKSLSQRLIELADQTNHVNYLLFGEEKRPSAVWCRTRNYYTHWNESDRAEALDGADLLYASARIRAWLRTLYLQHFGVPDEALAKALVGTSGEAQWLIQINAEERRKSDPASNAGAFGYITIKKSREQED